ncbi:MAG: RNA polymerase sigma factor [Planctomycetia bacterium]|nr:RNA polymerase sigma factor [Planctomycetia bacterium]
MAKGQPDKAENFLKHLAPLQATLAAFCRRWLRDRNEVADVLQSALATAYRDFHLYAEGTNFRSWIFRYVTYEVLNRNRAAVRRRMGELTREVAAGEPPSLPMDQNVAELLLEEPELVLDRCDDALAGAVHALPDLERSIFLLRSIGDFKYSEIAEILEIPIGTVMGLLSRSRDRLRQQLLDYAKSHGLLPREDRV